MVVDKPIGAVEVNVNENQGVTVGTNCGIINFTNISKMPSLIADIVKAMANVDETNSASNIMRSVSAFKLDEKIKYNEVIKYKEIINEHSMYYSQCEDIINIFDDSNIGTKLKIFRCVKNWYLEAKGDVLKKAQNKDLPEIDVIRPYSDDLIQIVKNKIFDVAKTNAQPDVSVEDIEIGVVCFTCFCFMECKILEKPL